MYLCEHLALSAESLILKINIDDMKHTLLQYEKYYRKRVDIISGMKENGLIGLDVGSVLKVGNTGRGRRLRTK